MVTVGIGDYGVAVTALLHYQGIGLGPCSGGCFCNRVGSDGQPAGSAARWHPRFRSGR